jgi:hypothetical protein
LILSVHVAPAQSPLVHAPLEQSGPTWHTLPVAQCGQAVPPQSTSVSVPSRTPFVQLAVATTQLEPLLT